MAEFGYAGEILQVDLSDGINTTMPTADYADKFIGGQGIGVKLYWDMVPPQAGAFDPENCLIYTSGPLTGFPGFAGFRWKVCGKSPAGDRDTFCYANFGERWGAFLKYAGYDALTVRGKTEKPVYLFINNETVEIRDASDLWGKTAFDTIDILKKEMGKKVSVLTIGPAAENLVSYATMLADEGASGSGGLGAVMGSKKLKAIVVSGDKRPVAANPQKVRQLVDYIRKIRPQADLSSRWSVPGITKPHACYGCGLGCSRQMYTGDEGRHYKSFCQAYGFYLQPVTKYYGDWHEAHLLSIRLCDGYGLDTAIMHGLIEWLDACYQEGLLSEEETGLPLSKVGSREFIEALTGKIASREGFGDVLARGTIEAARSVGARAEAMLSRFIATGMSETKDYDPRMIMTTALLYATEPRRPIQQLHEVSGPLMMWLGLMGGEEDPPLSSESLRKAAARAWDNAVAVDFSTYEGKALAARRIQDRIYVKESLVLCDLMWPLSLGLYPGAAESGPPLESQILSAITGKETDGAGLDKTGERIFNLQRAILLRQGWEGRKGDRLLDYFHTEPLRQDEVFFNPDALVPGRDGESMSKVGAVVDIEEFEKMKTEYYGLRGWDAESGLPTKDKLRELQLEDIALELEGQGLLR